MFFIVLNNLREYMVKLDGPRCSQILLCAIISEAGIVLSLLLVFGDFERQGKVL